MHSSMKQKKQSKYPYVDINQQNKNKNLFKTSRDSFLKNKSVPPTTNNTSADGATLSNFEIFCEEIVNQNKVRFKLLNEDMVTFRFYLQQFIKKNLLVSLSNNFESLG